MLSNDKVVIDNTIYSLFLYMLFDNDWMKRDYILIGDRIPFSFESKLKEKVQSCIKYETGVLRVKKGFFSLLKDKKTLLKIRNDLSNYKEIYGNMDLMVIDKTLSHINKFHVDDGSLTKMLLTKGEFRFSGLKGFLLIAIYKFFHENPFEKKYSYILPSSYKDLNIKFDKHVEFIDFHKKWNQLTVSEKNNILYLFDYDMNSNDDVLERRNNILITQPLSEDSLCSECEKIQIYKKLLSKYNIREDELIIKPHPAEKTNYSVFFKDAIILSSSFPCEILTLLNVKFNVAITLFSTAIYNIKSKKTIIEGSGLLNNLKYNVERVVINNENIN